MSLTTTDLPGLALVARGKVRDIYQLSPEQLLFVATDRILAYDVIMTNGIPSKGKILTKLLEFWFDFLTPVPNHLVAKSETVFEHVPAALAQEPYRTQLASRALVVRKLQLVPLEVIVRGYITGSAWKEYQAKGTVHGLAVPLGLQQCEKLPTPIYTPLTKAEQGEHDENIHPDQAAELVGAELAARVEKLALELYTRAHDYALTRGIIIADTKFEFGLDAAGELVLVDEVLTPDSLRFWRQDTYAVGRDQDSYDKQFLRNWLTANGLAGKDGVAMSEEVAHKSKDKYIEAYEALVGAKWQE